MCIIAAKPAGVKMPDDETIARMWYRNRDGAGIMYAKDGKVRIDKGFMSLDDLKAHLAKVSKTVNLDDTAVVMHFRITTHGGTCPENCHPFPITRSIKLLKTLHQSAPIGIAHNGIIPNHPRKGISDTMEYIASQLAPLYDMNRRFVRDKYAMELIENAIDSKMAFLTGSGEIYLVGDFIEDNGIKYSNTSFKAYETTSKFFAGPYGSWDDVPFDCREKDLFTDSYEEIPLMWCGYLPDGSYFRLEGDPDMFDDFDDLMIDEKGRAYTYEWDDQLAYPCPDIIVYDMNGNPAKFDEEQADLEPVGYTYEDLDDFEDVPAAPPKEEPKKSKDKTSAGKSKAKKL